MNIKIASELVARLIFLAAPTLPPPILRPDITPRQVRRTELKANKRR